MAQAALFLACNQYAYGQVCYQLTRDKQHCINDTLQTVTVDGGYLLEHP